MPLDDQILVDNVDKLLDTVMDRLSKGWDPIWQSQTEMGKALLTMSSGTLVLSISIVQFFRDSTDMLNNIWLLPLAWALLGISIFSTILRFGWMSRAQAFRIAFEHTRGDIRHKLRDLDSSGDISKHVDEIIIDAFSIPWARAYKGIRVHDGLTQAAFWPFVAALVCLIVFATLNLPSQ